jgi:hypothetical protein
MQDAHTEVCRVCGQPFGRDESVAFFHHTGEYVHPGCVYSKSTAVATHPWLSTWVPGALRCEECSCIGERAGGWIAKIVDDEESPERGAYVVSYCPVCAEHEFEWASPLVAADG